MSLTKKGDFMEKEGPVTKELLVKFFKGYRKYEEVFETDSRLYLVYAAYLKDPENFLKGTKSIADFTTNLIKISH